MLNKYLLIVRKDNCNLEYSKWHTGSGSQYAVDKLANLCIVNVYPPHNHWKRYQLFEQPGPHIDRLGEFVTSSYCRGESHKSYFGRD